MASRVIRECSKLAFKEHGRSMVASDLIPKIHTAFDHVFTWHSVQILEEYFYHDTCLITISCWQLIMLHLLFGKSYIVAYTCIITVQYCTLHSFIFQKFGVMDYSHVMASVTSFHLTLVKEPTDKKLLYMCLNHVKADYHLSSHWLTKADQDGLVVMLAYWSEGPIGSIHSSTLLCSCYSGGLNSHIQAVPFTVEYPVHPVFWMRH